ncbi:MAG TPA: zinc ABC transporter solute-binding protein [Clostridiales bacterium]|nr:zinc ABC transporter solute-binding protein [Clostridiales bacterium]
MMKKWITILLCLMVAVSLSACSNKNQETKTDESSTPGNSTDQTSGPEESPVKVSVTFDAMKEFVAAVGKDKVEISTIIPDGMEAHDFEPKAQDLAALSTARIFVYSGLGMEAWAEEAIEAAGNAELIIVEASKGADIIERKETEESGEHEEEHEGDEEHEEGEAHGHGKYDPHIWLGLKSAQVEVENIKNALVQADPSNKDYYEANCSGFVSQLESLYNEYNEKFQSVERKNFVTGHAAFGYLCRDFGLEQNSVKDIFAEGEPSAQQLAELVEYCKENKVTTIFAEEMASPEVSQTLANEVGAKVETIYTIESSEDGMTYLERMTDNLSKIYDSLK